ncbi:hypothetical protein [Stenotrophomonas sp. NRRL B-14846]|uniref:hypothetical protein n=1 Tax=Stenotrophomonas sp. NRRL B-14846 TaxID=3162882 RepID=UPI003D2768ED
MSFDTVGAALDVAVCAPASLLISLASRANCRLDPFDGTTSPIRCMAHSLWRWILAFGVLTPCDSDYVGRGLPATLSPPGDFQNVLDRDTFGSRCNQVGRVAGASEAKPVERDGHRRRRAQNGRLVFRMPLEVALAWRWWRWIVQPPKWVADYHLE